VHTVIAVKRCVFGGTGSVPRFVVEPQSQIVKPGDTAILTCTVEPNNVAIQWTFKGRALTDTVSHRRGRSRDDSDRGRLDVVIRRRGLSTHHRPARNEHSLHIAAFDASLHEGVYQCMATSSDGSLLSRPAALEPAGFTTDMRLTFSSSSRQKHKTFIFFVSRM